MTACTVNNMKIKKKSPKIDSNYRSNKKQACSTWVVSSVTTGVIFGDCGNPLRTVDRKELVKFFLTHPCRYVTGWEPTSEWRSWLLSHWKLVFINTWAIWDPPNPIMAGQIYSKESLSHSQHSTTEDNKWMHKSPNLVFDYIEWLICATGWWAQRHTKHNELHPDVASTLITNTLTVFPQLGLFTIKRACHFIWNYTFFQYRLIC